MRTIRTYGSIALLVLSTFVFGCSDSTSGSTTTGSESADTSAEEEGGETSHGGESTGAICESTADCVDDDPCTLEVCEAGACAYYSAQLPGCSSPFDAALCKDDSECAQFAEGQGSCVTAYCDSDTKECRLDIPADGTACDDGDPCTEASTCLDGDCTAGTALTCDDGDACTDDNCIAEEEGCRNEAIDCADDNPCTTASCDSESGCVYTPVEGACDDGDLCTENDACVEGECVGEGSGCDDGNPCTIDACDADGNCTNTVEVGALCDDGNACTEEDACNEEALCAGVDAVCDDDNICTDSGCDPELGCVFTPNDADCGDGDPCNGLESCLEGACVTDSIPACGDGVTDDVCGEQCDDGNTNDGDGCSSVCVEEAPVACLTDADCDDTNVCTDTACTDGECAVSFNTAGCDDGDACTTDDACNAGTCGGDVANCDDEIECTADSCDAILGCSNVADDSLCDDGNECTADDCSEASGCLAFPLEGQPCDDGDACTSDDVCGLTVGGTAVCEGDIIEACGDAEPICSLVGAAGETVSCFFRIARGAEGYPGVPALQFNMSYDPAELTLENLYDEICPVPTSCFPVSVMGGSALSSGHTVSSSPGTPEACDGLVSILLSNISDPLATLSDAYIDEGGVLQGEPVFMEGKFILVQDASEEAPFQVFVDGIVASTSGAEPVSATIEDEVIISGTP